MANSGNDKTVGNGRFGISLSGEFNAPYKFENMLKLIILAAGAGFIALVTFVSIKVLRNTIASLPEGRGGDQRLFPAIVAAFVILSAVAITFLVVGFTVKYIGTGFKCTYAANDEKMMLDYGKTEFIVFYQDVDLVEFSPRSFFNKINGYDVQIRINGEIQEFSIVSDSYISPKSTPFFIIKTQAENIRTANVDANDENRTQREIAMNIGSGRAISQAEIERARIKKTSVYDRLGELLGEGGDSVSNAEPQEYVSPYDGKVSPTAEGYSGDLPKATAMFERKEHEIVLDNGRERDLYEIMKAGSFYVAPDKKSFIIALIIWFLLGGAVGAVIGYIIAYYTSVSVLFFALVIAVGVYFLIHGLKHQRGREYKFRADGRSFKITTRGKPEENILYSEVAGVTYTPKNLFGKPYALNVSIVTRHGTLNYRYLYPRFGKEIKESELPFAIIKDNIRKE
ncbi:MAG: hypothetical protein K2N06_07530 [Oscillospiraceae bacterium]|nr:hypothetical protein [Oscillospiraceae bacterium]